MAEPYDLSSDEAQKRLLQMHRHAQVGGCVSGIAHDVNNLLGAAMAYAELVSYDEGISAESSKMLNQVVDGISKCSRLVTSLTSISRKERVDVSLVTPEQLIDEVLVLRDYELKIGRIEVERDYRPDVAAISVDMAKLKLALLYLMFNAEEAVASAPRKLVKVSVSQGDGGVNFDIWDSGPGLSPEHAEQAFEAFTSFWPNAESHVGLGLFSARRVAELHGGSLSYSPDYGFRIFVKRDSGLEDSR